MRLENNGRACAWWHCIGGVGPSSLWLEAPDLENAEIVGETYRPANIERISNGCRISIAGREVPNYDDVKEREKENDAKQVFICACEEVRLRRHERTAYANFSVTKDLKLKYTLVVPDIPSLL